ncbi:hypothetical protein AURANDRAFT_23554 [Aureococcus anophagefferens]|uniref:WASH complex subunit strumpellin n=1 Tax=Aureococcus anophagefferens TaxID=44056 RepID=F0Y365_AURAN|nr:hypothetical protein AURANDRAFT_23554 [Aureococcus anophagefferens]EGB10206.1 hypothetical protein AURANDRAFT_23554 [Aureococcus anophagefferens]|eukprot:XP_009035028.1 hypothetical protein AURANDRAFT_23554 [Aureococcus anophagefferens]
MSQTPSLLDDGNLCGATLLSLVASGSALIAELLRLAQAIPPVFLDAEERARRGAALLTAEEASFEAVLFDFAYLKEPEDFENRVNSSDGLLDVDNEFLETHGAFAKRFYALMESTVKYWRDVHGFLERLGSGYFIAHSVDNVLEDVDGKQLLCEAYFLYGTLLVLLDAKVPGVVRERLVIACYRLEGESTMEAVDDVCRLARSTGYRSGGRRPKNYPEAFFNRFRTDATASAAKLVIQRLMSDDVYLQSAAFPAPEHRSVRLASQASMLYVILYFDADTLKGRTAAMREVVDKHFSDNWVVPVYMGHVVDLSVEWAGYGAAAAALRNVLTDGAVGRLVASNDALVHRQIKELDGFLTEGQLTEQHLLDHMRALLDCARRSNAALRWRLLHRRCAHDGWRSKIAAKAGSPGDAEALMTLLLKASQLEYKLKQMFQSLLDSKPAKWAFCKQQVIDRMTELSEYFTGEKALARVARDENLMKWFGALAGEMARLDDDEAHATMMGRKIQTLVGALEEVEQFEQVDTNLQIKAFLADTREFLLQMVRITNVQHSVMHVIESVSDLSYAFDILGDYVPILHDRVRGDPRTAVLLRATFLKLASILDVPLIRISQCNSSDQASVASYYSTELVNFVRRVLDVIPVSVFGLLDDIVDIQTRTLAPLPVKLETAYLKDYAQLNERYQLARLTHQVSVFTEGVLAMERTLLGVVRVEPRRVLHDGLRKELVRQLSRTLHEQLRFPVPKKDQDRKKFVGAALARQVHEILAHLGRRVDGYRRSVEYVQDYIDIAGLKMWQEELGRVVNYNVEAECNRYLRRKVADAESRHQSSVVPVPRFAPLPDPHGADDGAATFMGRTLAALLRLTSPATTSYAPERAGWYCDAHVLEGASSKGRLDPGDAEACGVHTFQIAERALGVCGLAGLDRMLAFRVVHDLSNFVDDYKALTAPHARFLESLRDALFPEWAPPRGGGGPGKLYARAAKTLEAAMPRLLHRILAVGHAQLLRKSLNHALLLKARVDADFLHASLTNVDGAVLGDVLDHYGDPETVPDPVPDAKDGRRVLADLATLLDASGVSDPLAKVYVATEPLEHLPLVLLLFLLSYAHKLGHDDRLQSLVKRKRSYPIDGFVVVVGVHTVLKQCHPSYCKQLLAYLGQFVCSTVTAQYADAKQAKDAAPLELANAIWFVDTLCKVADVPKPTDFIPAAILAMAYKA